MPFVEHQAAQFGESRRVGFPAQKQVQGFGCCDEHLWLLPVDFLSFFTGCVARTHGDLPVEAEVGAGAADGFGDVFAEGFKRGNPQQAQPFSGIFFCGCLQQHRQGESKGFPAPGGRIQESARRSRIGLRHFELKRERFPVSGAIPVHQTLFRVLRLVFHFVMEQCTMEKAYILSKKSA